MTLLGGGARFQGRGFQPLTPPCFRARLRLYCAPHSAPICCGGATSMGLLVLILGLILFLGPHVFVTMRPHRDAAVKQFGEWPYKVAFAVVTIVGLFVAGKGFGMYEAAGLI